MKRKTAPTLDDIIIMSEMMANGGTPTQVCARLRISRKMLSAWLRDPEFSEEFEIGKITFEAKMEEIGQKIMLGEIQNCKENTWYRFMTKYAGWTDKTEQKLDLTERSMTDEEIQEKLERFNKNERERAGS